MIFSADHTILVLSESSTHQSDIDGAYAVRIFLQHHPCRYLSIAKLAEFAGVKEERLKETFLEQFGESLEEYWERQQGNRILC